MCLLVVPPTQLMSLLSAFETPIRQGLCSGVSAADRGVKGILAERTVIVCAPLVPGAG